MTWQACHIVRVIVSFANRATEPFAREGRSKFSGLDSAKAMARLQLLHAAASLEDIPPLRSVGLHALSGDRQGQWAMTITARGGSSSASGMVTPKTSKSWIIIEAHMTQFAFQQVHPGAILKEELAARGLSANAFALKLRVPPQRIQDIVAERRGISPETALRLEASLGTPARLWLDMQAAYDLFHTEARIGEAVRSEVLAA